MRVIKYVGFLVLMVVIAISCKRDLSSPEWEVDALIPIAKTSLNLSDVLKDTNISVDSDNFITITLDQEIYRNGLGDLIKLDVPPFETSASLRSLTLAPIVIGTDITMAQIGRGIGGTLEAIIFANQGALFPFPNIPNLDIPPFAVNADQIFKSLTLNEGTLTFSITNNLALDLENVSFEIRNTSDGSIVHSGSYPSIPVGTTVSDVVDLAGKTLEADMEVVITNVDVVGGIAIIDTTDAISASLVASNLKVQSAEAIFPEQNVIEDTVITDVDNGTSGFELSLIKIKSGTMKLEVFSTLGDTLYFNYQLPTATLNGIPFEVNEIIPPAISASQPSVIDIEYDFAGYNFDISGWPQGTTYNQFPGILTGRVDSKGRIVPLSLEDSINVQLSIQGLVPAHANGYLGTEIFDPVETIESFTSVSTIPLEDLELESAKVSVVTQNGLGALVEMEIQKLEGRNSGTNQSVALDLSGINNPVQLGKAIENPLTPDVSKVTFDSGNSNISDFININPDEIVYDLKIVANPNGNDGTYTDFADCHSDLVASVEIEVPLSIRSKNTVELKDTSDFSFNGNGTEDIGIGHLNLIVYNQFPVEIGVDLVFLNDQNEVLETITGQGRAAAGSVNAAGKVTEKIRSVIEAPVSQELFNSMKKATKIVIVASFDTKPQGEFVKIYDDYEVDVKIAGDFKYTIAQ